MRSDQLERVAVRVVDAVHDAVEMMLPSLAVEVRQPYGSTLATVGAADPAVAEQVETQCVSAAVDAVVDVLTQVAADDPDSYEMFAVTLNVAGGSPRQVADAARPLTVQAVKMIWRDLAETVRIEPAGTR